MEIVAAFIGTALVIAAVIVLEWKAGLLRDWRAQHPEEQSGRPPRRRSPTS
jgi:hypothetical protein